MVIGNEEFPPVARQMGWPVRDSEMSGGSAVEDCLG